MPKIASTPSKTVKDFLPNRFAVEPLSNARDHLGNRVRIVLGKFRGLAGIITAAFTAETPEKNERDKGRRGVFYTVTCDDVILTGITWQDFTKETK